MQRTPHCLSIDLEDWYHDVEGVVPVDGAAFARAFDRQLARIEAIVDEAGVKATFFTLGKTAERAPRWIKRLHAAGHEIASHGYGHDKLPTLTPTTLRDDVRRSVGVLGDLTGVRPRGYRAPFFSLGKGEAWAWDVLCDEGFAYSSSVFPFPGRRYGIGDHPLTPVVVERAGGALLEVPLSVVQLGPRRVPIAGGGFWRVTPLPLIEQGVRQLEREGRALVLYLHPHEFDDEDLRSHRGVRRNLFVNLGRRGIGDKLRAVLRGRRFGPIGTSLPQLAERPATVT
jgi:polysaccharide deacetylase family protein (PEP-CTERM system associated)